MPNDRSISNEIDYLDSDLNMIAEHLSELEKAITPVLSRPDEDEPGLDPVPGDPTSSDLYDRVSYRRQRALALAARINAITERVEV